MQILAHRGLWKRNIDKNSMNSFILSFKENIGIETDLRDFNGDIVISHDPVDDNKDIILFEDLLKFYKKYKSEEMLALNIKSDGIILKAENLLNKFEIKNYFFFDMSIPELVSAHRHNIKKIFCRNSEYESSEKVLNLTTGVWIDSFDGIHRNLINSLLYYLNKNKKIAIVSPELHRKDHKLMYDCWEGIKFSDIPKNSKEFIMLCTDNPLLAREFFKNDN